MSRLNTYTLPTGPLDPSNPADGGAPDYRKVISSTTPGLTTTSTSNVYLYSILIPANTFAINEVLDLRAMATVTNTRTGIINPFCALRFYWGPNPSLSGATQLGVCTYQKTSNNTGALPFHLHRRLGIRNTTTSTIVLDTIKSSANDIRIDTTTNDSYMTGGVDYLAINWTTDFYFIVAGNTSGTDVLQVRYMKINN
jgi:hypothetical protein